LLSGKISTGIFCTISLIVLGRVEEFLYRTFSHQEFALAIIAAGIYYFYRERFILAAAILGIAANFHALYSLFPFIYLATYLVLERRRLELKKIFAAAGIFLLAASPLIFLVIKKFIQPGSGAPAPALQEWLKLYFLACPQNFVFYTHTLKEAFSSIPAFFEITKNYWELAVLFALNYYCNPLFRQDKKTRAALWAATGLLIFSAVFSHLYPIRLIVDLNLVRNTQYMLFFLLGYTIVLAADSAVKRPLFITGLIAIFLPLIRFGDFIQIGALLAIGFILAMPNAWPKNLLNKLKTFAFFIGAAVSAYFIFCQFQTHHYRGSIVNSLLAIWIMTAVLMLFGLIAKKYSQKTFFRLAFLSMILGVMFINFVYYHRQHLRIEKEGAGVWQIQRNWVDIQNYIRANTPKGALFLTPYDTEMGGFRIGAERPVVVCYRDCGIIGFDYPAAVEWQKRVKDVAAFQVIARNPIGDAIKTAITKYRVNYIVFMNYANPGNVPFLKKLYENEVFSLYQVLVNPVLDTRY